MEPERLYLTFNEATGKISDSVEEIQKGGNMTENQKRIGYQMFEKMRYWEYSIYNTPATPLSLRANAHFGRVFSCYRVFNLKKPL